MKRLIIMMLLLLPAMLLFPAKGQVVWEHVSDKSIYSFMDELANAGIIELNSAVKPYSRKQISEALLAAQKHFDELSVRQQKEVRFYLESYKLETDSVLKFNAPIDLFPGKEQFATTLNPVGGFYKDRLFSFGIKPIWGINYFSNQEGTEFHRWGGAETYAYIGDHWGLYASLRDNNETKRITEPEYFTLRPGGAYKGTPGGGGDYSEMRGGITYAWKWGSVGLVKDHINWGNHVHGAMIFSEKPPSFAQIQLHMKPVKWFEFRYIHGWLVSLVVDSVRSDFSTDPPREVFRPKYVAANLFTFTPWRKLNISVGNSIVYSDMNVHPAYLIPVMFYKSIDHTLNEGIDNQNSQMFLDISSRNIRNVHLYGTFYIDELKVSRITDPNTHNFWSAKGGVSLTNALVPNLFLRAEYGMSMPITYEHRVPTLTFASNNYNMGFYMRDNSSDLYLSAAYKPIRGMTVSVSYNLAKHGPDYPYVVSDTVSVRVDEHPFMERVIWQKEEYGFHLRYEVVNNAYLFAGYLISDITGEPEAVEYYTPALFRGSKQTFSFGFNLGF